jgi:WD40 repeat protein
VLRGSAGPISPDGQWLLTVVNGQALWLWNLKADDPSAEGKEVARCEESWKSLRGVVIGPGNRWLVTLGGDRALRLWDLKAKGKAAQPRILMERQGGFLYRSPDGRWLTTGSPAGKVGVWDLAADDPASTALVQQIKKEKGFAGPQGISPDGRWLVTVGPVRRLWRLRAKGPWPRAVGELGDADQVRVLHFSADSRWLATGGDDGQARLYDLAATDPVKRPIVLPGNPKPSNIEGVAFTPNGRWLAVTDGPTVHLWDMKAPDPSAKRVVLKGHQGPADFLAVSPNSRWLVTRSAGVWDLEAADPAAVRVLLGAHGGGEKLFSPDSRWLVTLDEDKTARLWDLKAATK